ncbi:BRO family protein [Hymenobacter nivis]|uniref:Bro-N domain-containing protein n=1 Tax=Hymenobacter nivis TaxID=1850093 RepID=A0A2Z3GRP9_9BACT|nr:BRO family protein [Hymenobacter nivis]AWM31330.1 hypothetical protein DDQ68_00140 [Hymenobacter nivis]
MKKVQLFDFNSHEVGTLTDENGNPWFVAKNVAAAIGLKWNGNDTLKAIKPEWKLSMEIPYSGQVRRVLFISEAAMYKLAFRSDKLEAEAFTDWVAEVVLPTLRKTGTYSLQSQLLPSPRSWEKTFPTEFMRNVLKLYGQPYNPKGTPQFVGLFINKYVYNCMDCFMAKELKAARASYGGDDEVAFLHQYLAEPAREALQSHIAALNTLMSASSNKEHFDLMFGRVYVHKNQLEMHLR